MGQQGFRWAHMRPGPGKPGTRQPLGTSDVGTPGDKGTTRLPRGLCRTLMKGRLKPEQSPASPACCLPPPAAHVWVQGQAEVPSRRAVVHNSDVPAPPPTSQAIAVKGPILLLLSEAGCGEG